MWYEENDQFVRAPTPQTFDNLVQDLEGRDSVVFESIRLPSANGPRDSTASRSTINQSVSASTKKTTTIAGIPFELSDSDDSPVENPPPPIETRPIFNSTNDIELGSTLKSLDTSDLELSLNATSPNLIHLRDRVLELQRLNDARDREIEMKDTEIESLRAQIDKNQVIKSQNLDYKSLYETAFFELQSLKEALQAVPKPKKSKMRFNKVGRSVNYK
ncbi:hypothetical protein TVAG_074650 [Trichomonas vaginalis G3]|uniref:Uncharacterized protein n=1 Tax=Trichomonas vaginalis (strain ATCC PRA-98 / G3) TaxID=412133 RepID=A2E3Y2_TRIV3|nr:hypothetical protein TVAGG3_0147050 [Trichomonas vaginalis G3]EAY12637.1 hypothetical protein TVAG_074650 [Trichomonas vaginalis G3]KAI5546998.1 hypothetical protein TVAGG3_0147050 [Trichomonas vaginalis G3]|eukprot:XP_001324860.1 hypothetical protein [Trichomonas vaginalis G3]